MNRPFQPATESPSAASRTFFVTAKTSQGKALLQSDRMASLFLDVLRSYRKDARVKIHEFVIMRNYVQLLISVNGETGIDEALRRIKGRFAYRATMSFGIRGWIWERDVAAVRVFDRTTFLKHKSAMEQNLVNAGLAASADAYPYCSAYLRKNKALTESASS